MNLINKKFYNYNISKIIHSLLKVGYVNFGNSLINSRLKSNLNKPLGSLLSPLFCNILLHELDTFAAFLSKNIFSPKIQKLPLKPS